MNRPWYKPPPDEHLMGSEEIVGPGGLIRVGLLGVRLLDEYRIAEALRPLCESPIEVQLGIHLVRLLSGKEIVSVPQYRWHRWRMDFALKRPDGPPLLFIECDGRDFHSTSEQQANDRAKDRAARDARIPLMRFTGSAIYNDARACALLAIEQVAR